MKKGRKMLVPILIVLVLILLAAAGFSAAFRAGSGGEEPQEQAAVTTAEEEPEEEEEAVEAVEEEPEEEEEAVEAAEEESDAEESEESPAGEVLTEEQLLEQEISERIASMTLEEKVAQLFIVTPEALTGQDCVTLADEAAGEAFHACPVGGLVFFSENFESESQTVELLADFQAFSIDRLELPLFLCVDEEGGSVARVAGSGVFDVPDVGDMSDIGAGGDTDAAYQAGKTIGTYLSELGFNVDFAPVADVWTNTENTMLQDRAFGSSAELVSGMASAFLNGLRDTGVQGTYKHFPGHGNTAADTHDGYAYTEKTWEELLECELIPFETGISQGVNFIMVAHIALPNVTGDDTPASLSEAVYDLLRSELGYEGIAVTDALNMGAVTEDYTSEQAAVAALQAGADMILMPEDFESAFSGVLNAVESGELTEERIDESLERILRVKLQMQE